MEFRISKKLKSEASSSQAQILGEVCGHWPDVQGKPTQCCHMLRKGWMFVCLFYHNSAERMLRWMRLRERLRMRLLEARESKRQNWGREWDEKAVFLEAKVEKESWKAYLPDGTLCYMCTKKIMQLGTRWASSNESNSPAKEFSWFCMSKSHPEDCSPLHFSRLFLCNPWQFPELQLVLSLCCGSKCISILQSSLS